jgi:hypothetical protein
MIYPNLTYPSPPQPMYLNTKDQPSPPKPPTPPSTEMDHNNALMIRPNHLRVQIPNEESPKVLPRKEDLTERQVKKKKKNYAEKLLTVYQTPSTNNKSGPPSALPSQFAQNLPSPSTFYPEFYQQSEIPSPLNFSTSATPTTSTFHWPSNARDYRPSPLSIRPDNSIG